MTAATTTDTIATDTSAETVKVTYDGKDYQLPTAFTVTDDLLRQVMSANGLAGAANSLVERQADGSIQLVKRGGPNGNMLAETVDEAACGINAAHVLHDLVSRLSQLQPHINPAVQCDWELRLLEWQGRLNLTDILRWQGAIAKAATNGKAENSMVGDIESRLEGCDSLPDQMAPGLM